MDDQYVREIDKTEEAREKFAEDTTTRYKDPEGNLHDPFTPEGNWDSRFWRELTSKEQAKYGKTMFPEREPEPGLRLETCDWKDDSPLRKGYRTKAFAWPSDGWSEVKVPTATVETFAEFCADYYGHPVVPFGMQPDLSKEHKYGYTIVDENGAVVKTIDRTNPNRKWDWYSVGGRWNGFFKLRPLAVGVIGKPGIQTMADDYEPPAKDRADILTKGDIDVEGMRSEAGEKAADRWDRFHAIIAGLPEPLTWEQMQEKHRTGGIDKNGQPLVDWNATRKEFDAQPAVEALRNSDGAEWEVGEYMVPREQYIQQNRDYAVGTFAVVKDGQWYERGRMGWWGTVFDEKDENEWTRQFTELFDSLPDDTLLTVVDCHI
jgi:hypothetical protein